MNAIPVDYVDGDGFRRRALVPDEAADPAEGIPVSLPVELLYQHMPLAFQIALVNELWAVGLVEPADFLRSDALPKIRAALLAVVRKDTLDILNLAREMNHGK
jgi:hypothetical protein